MGDGWMDGWMMGGAEGGLYCGRCYCEETRHTTGGRLGLIWYMNFVVSYT